MANGVTQIRRSVVALALPVTVSSLLQRTEGIVAVFLVGGLGAIPIAAVGLGQLLAFRSFRRNERDRGSAVGGSQTS